MTYTVAQDAPRYEHQIAPQNHLECQASGPPGASAARVPPPVLQAQPRRPRGARRPAPASGRPFAGVSAPGVRARSTAWPHLFPVPGWAARALRFPDRSANSSKPFRAACERPSLRIRERARPILRLEICCRGNFLARWLALPVGYQIPATIQAWPTLIPFTCSAFLASSRAKSGGSRKRVVSGRPRPARCESIQNKVRVGSSMVEQRPFKALVEGSSPSQPKPVSHRETASIQGFRAFRALF